MKKWERALEIIKENFHNGEFTLHDFCNVSGWKTDRANGILTNLLNWGYLRRTKKYPEETKVRKVYHYRFPKNCIEWYEENIKK